MSHARQSKGTRQARSLPVRHACAAGIDIGAKFHVVAVPPHLSEEPVRTYQSITTDLHRLARLKDTPEKGRGLERAVLRDVSDAPYQRVEGLVAGIVVVILEPAAGAHTQPRNRAPHGVEMGDRVVDARVGVVARKRVALVPEVEVEGTRPGPDDAAVDAARR